MSRTTLAWPCVVSPVGTCGSAFCHRDTTETVDDGRPRCYPDCQPLHLNPCRRTRETASEPHETKLRTEARLRCSRVSSSLTPHPHPSPCVLSPTTTASPNSPSTDRARARLPAARGRFVDSGFRHSTSSTAALAPACSKASSAARRSGAIAFSPPIHFCKSNCVGRGSRSFPRRAPNSSTRPIRWPGL